MIPKTIHYCWFGRGEKPESVKKYIEGWHKILSDYTFKEWNEDNFDIYSNQYVSEAYACRRFAFVTDYVRLYALYHEGGVYMDTDVEVLSTYNPFLHHTAFSGFETDGNVPTGMMAAEKGSIWAKELLAGYEDRRFIKHDGSQDTLTNTAVITKYMVEKGLVLNNTYQNISGLCTMYPSEYFCPKDHRTGKIKCTDKTVCIHHFAGTWLNLSWKDNLRHKTKMLIVRIIGDKIGTFISDLFTGRKFRR